GHDVLFWLGLVVTLTLVVLLAFALGTQHPRLLTAAADSTPYAPRPQASPVQSVPCTAVVADTAAPPCASGRLRIVLLDHTPVK
ncbi:MAG TPA: hypothetical protein VNS49_04090, partial [Streptomyces sp.]|nr:hypothetical protein [Streptomyces sp.]